MHPFIWTVHSVTIMQFTFPNPKLLLFGLNVKHIRGVFHVRLPEAPVSTSIPLERSRCDTSDDSSYQPDVTDHAIAVDRYIFQLLLCL